MTSLSFVLLLSIYHLNQYDKPINRIFLSTFESNKLKSRKFSWALVAHSCNPNYSGGRGQEDSGSKPA
jgi:hypothetical protein